MRKYFFPCCFSLQFFIGIAKQFFLNAKLLADSGRIGILMLTLSLGSYFCFCADHGNIYTGKSLPFGFCLGLSFLNQSVYIHNLRLGSGCNLLIQAGLIFQCIMVRVQIFCSCTKLIITIGNQRWSYKRKQKQENNNSQRNHSYGIFLQTSPGILPVGNTLTILNEIISFLLTCRFEIFRSQLRKKGFNIRLKADGTSLYLIVFCHSYSPPLPRLIRGSATL